jgi:hypothetical protein
LKKVCRKERLKIKDFIAIFIALLETTFLPIIVTMIVIIFLIILLILI